MPQTANGKYLVSSVLFQVLFPILQSQLPRISSSHYASVLRASHARMYLLLLPHPPTPVRAPVSNAFAVALSASLYLLADVPFARLPLQGLRLGCICLH